MAAQANLSSRISLDDSRFNARARAVVQTANRMGRGISSALRGAGARLAAFVKQFGGLRAAFAGAAVGAGALVGIGKAISSATNIEDLNIDMETFLGSTQRARDLIAELTQFSVSTPFETDDLLQTSRILAGSGIQEGLAGIVKELGAVSSNGQQLRELGDALAKGFAKGKFQTEELNKFLERGINLMPALEEATGLTGEALTKAIQSGLDFDTVTAAIRSLSAEGGQFFGLLERRSRSTSGLISTLSGAWDNLLQKLGTPINDAIKPGLTLLIDGINGGVGLATQLGAVLASGISAAARNMVAVGETGVNAYRAIQAAFAQGQVGNILVSSLQLAGGVLVNNFIGAIRFLREGLISAVSALILYWKSAFVDGAAVDFYKAFGSGMVNTLAGVATILRGQLGGAINSIIATFQAGMAFGIENVLEQLGNVPFIGDKLGLADFEASSFEQLQREFSALSDSEQLVADGKQQLQKAVQDFRDAFTVTADVAGEFADNFDVPEFRPGDVVDTGAFREKLGAAVDAVEFEKVKLKLPTITPEVEIDGDPTASVAPLPLATPINDGASDASRALTVAGDRILSTTTSRLEPAVRDVATALQDAGDGLADALKVPEGKIKTFNLEESELRREARVSDRQRDREGETSDFFDEARRRASLTPDAAAFDRVAQTQDFFKRNASFEGLDRLANLEDPLRGLAGRPPVADALRQIQERPQPGQQDSPALGDLARTSRRGVSANEGAETCLEEICALLRGIQTV